MSNPALISKQETLTYEELNRRVTKSQENFLQKGVRKKSCIFFVQPNSPQYVIDLLALWLLGVSTCLLSTRAPKRQIEKHKRWLTGNNLPKPATIMLTSGSSGEPKAVVHSLQNHYENARGANANIPVKPGDRWLLSLPLYHVSGIGIVWRCILAGAAVVFPGDLELEKALKHFKITHVSLVPTQLQRLMANKANIKTLQTLKAILLGGAPIQDDLLKTAKNFKLRVYPTYGLTETASQVATSQKPGGPLYVLKNRKLKIVDGEILLRGKILFQGYWKKGELQKPFDQDGWFKTGDLGSYTKKAGLKILGRKDNMFISGGENIYPEEIEKALLNTGLVDNAIVVPVNDKEFGARPVAFIKHVSRHCEPAKRARQSLLTRELAKTLPSFKIPARFYNFPAHYARQSMKVNRQALKYYCEQSHMSLLCKERSQ